MIIVDTTVWVEYFQGIENPETDWLNTSSTASVLGPPISSSAKCCEASATMVSRKFLELSVILP